MKDETLYKVERLWQLYKISLAHSGQDSVGSLFREQANRLSDEINTHLVPWRKRKSGESYKQYWTRMASNPTNTKERNRQLLLKAKRKSK